MGNGCSNSKSTVNLVDEPKTPAPPSGRCVIYVHNPKQMTLLEAYKWCSMLEGKLPVPKSAEENKLLAKLGSTWLGFTTTDAPEPPQYTNWSPNEPSGDSTEVQLIAGKYGPVNFNGRWNDGKATWPATCVITKDYGKTHETYARNINDMTLVEAHNWSSKIGGKLPIPKSAEENEFLADLGSTWLGFSAINAPQPPEYTNWAPHEPSGDSTEVQLIAGSRSGYKYNGRWNDGNAKWPATCIITKDKSDKAVSSDTPGSIEKSRAEDQSDEGKRIYYIY